MSYIEKSLADDETLVSQAKFHWTWYAAAWSALVFLGVLIIGVIIFAKLMVYMKTTEIAVTDRRLVIKRGWLKRSTEELALASVEEVNLEQGLWSRLIGIGRLTVGGTGGANLKTPMIANPVAFRADLSEARSRLISSKPVAPASRSLVRGLAPAHL